MSLKEIISPKGAVPLSAVQAANSAFLESITQPIVGVFVGGNSGICEYALRALVSTTAAVSKKKGHAPDLRIYIVARNARTANVTISDCRKLVPSAKFTFVKAEDLSLIKDVDRVCGEIVRLEKAETPNASPKLDLLYMSQAGMITGVRNETKEGLDKLMALMYYSRMRFVVDLLPLLLESKLPAHVVSIYAAGMEDKLFQDDLALRQPGHFDYNTARSHMVYMKALFMDELTSRHPGKISFSHVFPGLVLTPGFKNPDAPLWFRLLFPIVGRPLVWMIGLPAQEAGARMLYLATPKFPARGATTASGGDDVAVGFDGKPGSGVYSVWHKSNIKDVREAYEKVQKDDLREKVWNHTNKAFDDIAAGRVFKE